MKLEIIKVIDRGLQDKERLWLRVLADTDLVYFIILDTNYTSRNSLSGVAKHTYWFKSKKVKTGDYIVLYTRVGVSSETKNNDGSNTYFLFWGLDKTIWNKEGDCAVVFEANTWKTTPYE